MKDLFATDLCLTPHIYEI